MDQIRHIQQMALSVLQLEAVVVTAWAALIASKLADVGKGWAIISAALFMGSLICLALVVAQVRVPRPHKRERFEQLTGRVFRLGLGLFGLGVTLTVILAITLLGAG